MFLKILNVIQVPKYRAAIGWLNGNSTEFPITSADVPKPTLLPCTPSCVWGVCYNGTLLLKLYSIFLLVKSKLMFLKGTCTCYDGYSGAACDQLGKKYLDCASNSTHFGTNPDGNL